MRAKWSVLRWAFISIYHMQVKMMYECGRWIKVWGRPDMSYLYNGQVICGASDGWQRPGCPVTGWEAAHFLFSIGFALSSEWPRQGWTDVPLSGLVLLSFFPVIIGGLSVRAANGLLHWSVKAVSFFWFSIWLRKLLSRSRLQQLMIYSWAQDRFGCNNLPDQAGSDCHSE